MGDESGAPRFFMGIDYHSVPDVGIALDRAAEDRFDFVCVPLVHPRLRHDRAGVSDIRAEQWTRSDFLLPSSRWTTCVVGKLSPWIRLDAPSFELRRASEVAFKREAAWASHLGTPAVLATLPRGGGSSANLARCINQLLRASDFANVWIDVPMATQRRTGPRALGAAGGGLEEEEEGGEGGEGDENEDEDEAAGGGAGGAAGAEADGDSAAWRRWHALRSLCGHHPRLSLALEIPADLPRAAQIDQWLGEPLRAAVLRTDLFLTNGKGFPVLAKPHQRLVQRLLKMNVQLVLRGNPLHKGERRHYLQYVAFLATRLPPRTEQEAFEAPYYDRLQVPLQPLADNLESQVYETFEKDPVKYSRYEEAAYEALKRKRAAAPLTVMVVGAGRGPLVSAALRAADRAACPVRVFAVEKNPNAVVTLRGRCAAEWGDRVSVVASDMRAWQTEERADVMISELLGSFGDNELSPECLDGAQAYLKEDGVSIPQSYTSYMAPLMSSKLWNAAKAFDSQKHMETPYVVRIWNAASLAAPQPCFRFRHPNRDRAIDNNRFCTLRFHIARDAVLHGLAGYFESTLFGDVCISINPETASEGMFSWFPCFFPFQTPVQVGAGEVLEVHVWRVVGPRDVWYEWAVGGERAGPIHNPNGRSYKIGL